MSASPRQLIKGATVIKVARGGTVVHGVVRPSPELSADALEDIAWRAPRELPGGNGKGLRLLESGVYRGKPWRVTTPSGAEEVVTEGDWLVTVAPRGIAGLPSSFEKSLLVSMLSESSTQRKEHEVSDTAITLKKAVRDWLAPVYKQAKKAAKRGDFMKARDLRYGICVTKLQLQEGRRAATRSYSRFGPNTAELFENISTLPDDRQVDGI